VFDKWAEPMLPSRYQPFGADISKADADDPMEITAIPPRTVNNIFLPCMKNPPLSMERVYISFPT
jgi:hypothetical protein